MNQRLKALLSPLSFAGYLAWGAIGWELMFAGWSSPTWLASPPPAALLAALHLAFLGLFMAVTSGPCPPWASRMMVIAQVLLALGLMTLVRNSSVPILLILCVVQLVKVFGTRDCIAIIIAMNVGMFWLFREIWDVQSPMISTLMHMSFQGFAALTAWFAHNAERTRDELAATNADLLATRSLLAESARDSERLRLSRELHDVAGHKLTALKINLAALARDPRFNGDERVALCARLADELLADIRGVVQALRNEHGLDPDTALRALAAPYPRPALQLSIDAGVVVEDPALAETVLRTVQEALTNAARHGLADTLEVRLRRDGTLLRVDIEDDGRATLPLREGHGLTGMRERIDALGGSLRIDRAARGGVRIEAAFPA